MTNDPKDIKKVKIIVFNCGSSSLKYALYENTTKITSGIIERIGEKGNCKSHKDALMKVIDSIKEEKFISSLEEIKVCGHRVVHGGDFKDSIVVGKNELRKLKQISELAPLHNPPEIKVIELCNKIIRCPQAAVFDTSFFSDIPEYAYMYAIPLKYYYKYKIRRYGFHGTSHRYITQETARILKRKNLKIISCHLGNGASVAAIKNGKAVDISMGFTPLEGLMMGTRSGDIDPAAALYIMKKEGISAERMEEILNKESGFLGVAGKKDLRDILDAKDSISKLAVEMFRYRVQKYIGAYASVMGGVDAIVFTGGIGEHIFRIKGFFEKFGYLGVKVSKKRQNIKNSAIISTPKSKVKVVIIHTDEELMIAKDCIRLLK